MTRQHGAKSCCGLEMLALLALLAGLWPTWVWADDAAADDAAATDGEYEDTEKNLEGRPSGLYEREVEFTYLRPTRVWYKWQTAVVPNMKHPPITRIRLYRQLDSGQWRVMGTLLQVHNDGKGKTPVTTLPAGTYKLEIYVKRMAWQIIPVYPDGNPFEPPKGEGEGEAPDKADAPPPADEGGPKPPPPAAEDGAADGQAPRDDDDEAPAQAPPDDPAPADDPKPDDARQWKNLVHLTDEHATPDRDYATFTLDRSAVVRFSWKCEPTGRPVFRVTLAAWNENLNKFTNIGVIVNTQARVESSVQKRMPADRYRIEVNANRTDYELRVDELLPEEQPEAEKQP